MSSRVKAIAARCARKRSRSNARTRARVAHRLASPRVVATDACCVSTSPDRLALKVDDEPPAPVARTDARASARAARDASLKFASSNAREKPDEDGASDGAPSPRGASAKRLDFGASARKPTPGATASASSKVNRDGTIVDGHVSPRARAHGGQTSGVRMSSGKGDGDEDAAVTRDAKPPSQQSVDFDARVRELERVHAEETSRLRESLKEAERRAKTSAESVIELQERVRALKEENVSEARVLSRMEAHLRRREHEFEAQRELLASQLEAAIYSANERDNEALSRDQEAREEIQAAKMAASEYELNDAQRREFSLKAGWCARYLHRSIDLKIIKSNADVEEQARFWTDAFGVVVTDEDTHASIARKIDDAIIADAKKPRLSFDVDTSLMGLQSTPEDDEIMDDTEVEKVALATTTSLPPSRNPSWPKNFRDALRVEIAMRHIIADRTEERIIISLADMRRASVMSKLSPKSEVPSAVALSAEEIREFHFRRAWVRFMWARAREANIDVGVSDAREEHWCEAMTVLTDVNLTDPSYYKRDAVAVDKALKELRTLSIETRLWR